MKDEQFRTNHHFQPGIKLAEVNEFEQEHYSYALYFPVAAGFDIQSIASDALLGNLFVNVTNEQLKYLRDALNQLEL